MTEDDVTEDDQTDTDIADTDGEETSNEADQVDETAEAEHAGSGSRAKNRLLVVLGVAAVAFAVLFVVTFIDRGRLQDDADRAADIAEVAGEFGVTLYTYDYRDIEGQLARMESLSTPRFASEYREGFEASLRTQIEASQVVSTSELTDVFVSRSEGDRARAIVIASTSVTRPNGTTATISGLIDVSMLKVGGEWLVDDVLTVANDGSVSDADGNPIQTPPLDGSPSDSTGSVPSVPDETEQEPTQDGG